MDDVHHTVEEIARVNEPTLGEVKAAIKGLQNGKAPGIGFGIMNCLHANFMANCNFHDP